jgi:hypothetical protein
MQQSQLERMRAAQELTREYASYSQQRAGLGNVLGGVAGLVVYFVGLLNGPGPLTALLTLAVTVGWLVGKELIRRRLYQAYGDARSAWPDDERQFHRLMTAFLGLISVWVIAQQVLRGRLGDPQFWPYILLVGLTPLIAWFWLRTRGEFIVGVFLLAAAALTSAGSAYTVGNYGLLFAFVPLVSLVMIGLGLREHRQFRALSTRLSQHGEPSHDETA